MSKIQAFPIVIRVSSLPTCLSSSVQTPKLQSFPSGVYRVYPKPSKNPICKASISCSTSHCVGRSKDHKNFQLLKPTTVAIKSYHKAVELNSFGRYGASVGGHSAIVSLQNVRIADSNVLSKTYSVTSGARSGAVSARRKTLPWLDDSNVEESKKTQKVVNVKANATRSSWEVSAEKYLKQSGKPLPVDGENRNKNTIVIDRGRKRHVEKEDYNHQEEDGNENEPIEDPRWDKIKARVGRVVNARRDNEKPVFRRWDKQEHWGRKTYREASDSNVPRMVGEGVYGVGPVLAALSSERREFYTLYVQEGIDLSSNNRKKKDKKGFEKVLRLADKIGLNLKEIPKHDLNMAADNRPHQGLLLDASPLEMVNIRHLDPVSPEGDRGLLWVALDEVTDPQNLGAIIRSSYFFGAAGVILCAKNSAPLSGVVSKASAGSLELMELRSCKNMMQFLSSSSENGWRVIGGSVSSRAVPLKEVAPGAPTILVLGSEGTGLRPLVERSCTDLVRIPGNIPVDVTVGRDDDEDEGADTVPVTSGEEFRSFLAVESLNVSVAAGVLLHHFIGSNYVGYEKDE